MIAELKRITAGGWQYPPKIICGFWNQPPDHHQIICAWSPEGAIRGGYVHQYSTVFPQLALTRTKGSLVEQGPGMGYFYREEKFNHPSFKQAWI